MQGSASVRPRLSLCPDKMPLFTSEALILRTYKLGETDRIVVFLTRDRGKRRGVAKGARRLRSRFTGVLEPLTVARVAYFERESKELVRLNYVEALHSPFSSSDPDSLGYVGYFVELLDQWALDADPNERLYRLGASVVEALAQEQRIERLVRYFEFWVLRLEGVYPEIVNCPRCGKGMSRYGAWFVLSERVLVCQACRVGGSGLVLSPAAVTFLQRSAKTSPDNLGDVELTERVSRELEVAHQAMISTHLDRELKSTKVLRETRLIT